MSDWGDVTTQVVSPPVPGSRNVTVLFREGESGGSSSGLWTRLRQPGRQIAAKKNKVKYLFMASFLVATLLPNTEVTV